MSEPILRTERTRTVLSFLLDSQGSGGVFGWDIIQQTAGLRSGTLYPILAKLEKVGWVTSSWEDVTLAAKEKRRPRRYYRLTDNGKAKARTYCDSFNGAPGVRQSYAPGATT